MKVLVLGASGATGRLVVMQLIRRNIEMRIVVREGAILSAEILDNALVEIKRGNITEFNDSEIDSLLRGCNTIVCCLGHNITLKGMFGKPRNLVFGVIRKMCKAIDEKTKIRLILMSTSAYTNTITGEKNSTGEKIIFSILKLLLPPHRDNVEAADYLQKEIGKDKGNIEWVAVRPDTLINQDTGSAYQVLESPVRSPVFNPGTVCRINVSHFMADLVTNDKVWLEWRFRMPILYNK